MRRAMFYCQHVLGMGHFVRSTEIVRGLKDFEVCFLNGGESVPGLELPPNVGVVNLPPLKSDAEFRDIEGINGTVLAEVKEERKRRILAEYERFRPDVLIVELFPFGRRKFAFELVPLLESIRSHGNRTKVVCSLRDILVSKRDQLRYEEQTCSLMDRYFDLLLVHSDPSLQRLEETFSRVPEIRCPIRYTGFVARKAGVNGCALEDRYRSAGCRSILASIGGGRVGCELLDAAIGVSALLASSLPHEMHVVTGPFLPDHDLHRLRENAAPNSMVTIERYTPNFVSRLRLADLSISMAGYNTCMEILATGVRALVYPFTGNNNEEQTIRARKLEERGAVTILHQHDLVPETLAARIVASLHSDASPSSATLDLGGVEKTAAILSELVQA